MQRENKLEVDKVRVCVNDRCKSVDDGDDIENIKPGDQITIEITVENKYSDSDREDVDFDDVEIEFEIDDRDFSEDDNENLGDLGADDHDSETFSFTIDDDVSDGNYDLVVRVLGDDENGAFHGEEIEIDFKVERDTHDIEIRNALLNPSKLECDADTTRVSVSITNIGKRDEDEVILEVVVDKFGIREQIGPLELDEDDSAQQSLILILPEDREAGIVNVIVRTLYDSAILSDEKLLELDVTGCVATTTTVASTTQSQATQQTRQAITSQRSAGTQRRPTVVQETWFVQNKHNLMIIAPLALLMILLLEVFLVLKIMKK